MQISLPVHSKVVSAPSWSSSARISSGDEMERMSQAVPLAESRRSEMVE